jgi:hypothetical protein
VNARALPLRFWRKVRIGDGCWEWQGAPNRNGYGRYREHARRQGMAHKVAYEAMVGPVPGDRNLDHICRNRACVRLSHLQIVTGRMNTLRGIGPTAVNARKTHCPQGHEYSPENTYRYRSWRRCRACHLAKKRARRERMKAG